MTTPLSLTAIVQQLRYELEQADRAAGAEPFFRIGECHIELGVTIEKSANGGINLGFVTLGGDRTKSNTTTITVSLQPLDELVAVANDTPDSQTAWQVEK